MLQKCLEVVYSTAHQSRSLCCLAANWKREYVVLNARIWRSIEKARTLNSLESFPCDTHPKKESHPTFVSDITLKNEIKDRGHNLSRIRWGANFTSTVEYDGTFLKWRNDSIAHFCQGKGRVFPFQDQRRLHFTGASSIFINNTILILGFVSIKALVTKKFSKSERITGLFKAFKGVLRLSAQTKFTLSDSGSLVFRFWMFSLFFHYSFLWLME